MQAFQRFVTLFNLITDSAYVAGLVERAEAAILKDVPNKELFQWLQLVFLLDTRQHPYFVMHVRSHTTLPGFIAEGNRQADLLTLPVQLPDHFSQEKLSHSFFHQNAAVLTCAFDLTTCQAVSITAVCPDCQRHSFPSVAGGVNPRGLQSRQIWQTYVTHFPEFDRLKYIHSSIDTFLGPLFASYHTGESAKEVCHHFTSAFVVLGILSQVKTDNGPAYISQRVANFLALWEVTHKTGIPHYSTGQAIIQRAHASLKRFLLQQKGAMKNATPAK